MPAWDQFLDYAARLVADLDMDVEERDYKLTTADRWKVALAAIESSDDRWPALLQSAAGYGNLVNQYAQTRLRNWIDQNPELVWAAFRDLAVTGQVSAFDEFEVAVRTIDNAVSNTVNVGPGSITTFASLVLMAGDPANRPPYRARFVASWAKLVGYPLGDSPRERYKGLLDLCDRFIELAVPRKLEVQDRLDAQGLAWAVLNYPPDVRWPPIDQARLSAWRDGHDTADVTVPRGKGWSPGMEEAAWIVLGAGLRGETSAIAPDLMTWQPDIASELERRIANSSDGGTGSFLDKLKSQLSGASDEALVLVAELLYVHSAPLTNVSPETKINRVKEVLRWTSQYELPDRLAHGLTERGAFNGGVGFNVQMWKQLTWLCRFVAHWTTLPASRRAAALQDPLIFEEIARAVPEDVRAMRYSLDYLAWPGFFPWVASADHRARILQAMAIDFGGATGNDEAARARDLVSLRQFHERANKGEPVDWYVPPYSDRWWSSTGPRAWLVRTADGGRSLTDQWIEHGFVSIKADMFGAVVPGASEAEIRTMVQDGYGHVDPSQRAALTTAYHRFLSVMSIDDLVVTIDRDRLLVGVITGSAEVTAEAGGRLRRNVTWMPTSPATGELPEPVPTELEQEGLVVDLTSVHDVLATLATAEPRPLHPGDQVPSVDTVPKLALVTDDLANSVYMSQSFIQEIVDLLQLRQQIVLYGPPGTGKTYLAQKIGRHLVGSDDPSRMRLVQFHPSYAYEDFFEGYRPTLVDGQPAFELQPGPLRLIAAEASLPENRGKPFVLIIDEMNRANLAKVFGELYFLLEYRHETVRLQYRPDAPFRLPLNLFIIGTMNTADRSIALVDAAIRRRFPFFELHPGEEPVRSVLANFVRRSGHTDDRSQLLRALNDAIGAEGRDLHVGPSYLMREGIGKTGGMDLAWRYDILPLLDEHFYGQHSREEIRRRFSLETLRKLLASQAPEPAAVDGSVPSADDVDS